MGPSAIHESGHFYFAQTGHSHFAATVLGPILTPRACSYTLVPPIGSSPAKQAHKVQEKRLQEKRRILMTQLAKALVVCLSILLLSVFSDSALGQQTNPNPVYVSGGPFIYNVQGGNLIQVYGAGITAGVPIPDGNLPYAGPNYASLAVGPDNADLDNFGNAAHPFLIYACDINGNTIVRFDPANPSTFETIYDNSVPGLIPVCGRFTSTGDFYVTNQSGSAVYVFSGLAKQTLNPLRGPQTPTLVSGLGLPAGFTGGGITQKNVGDLLVVDTAGNEVLRAPYGPPFGSATNYISTGLNSNPVGIARISTGDVFVANQGTSNVGHFSNTGAAANACPILSFPGVTTNTRVFYLAASETDTIYAATSTSTQDFSEDQDFTPEGDNPGQVWMWSPSNPNGCVLTSLALSQRELFGAAVAPIPTNAVTETLNATVASPTATTFSFNSNAFQITAGNGCSAMVTAVPVDIATVEKAIALAVNSGLPNGATPLVNLGEGGYDIAYVAKWPSTATPCTSVLSGGGFANAIFGLYDSTLAGNPRILRCDSSPIDSPDEPLLDGTNTCTALTTVGSYPLGGLIPTDTGVVGTGRGNSAFYLVNANFANGSSTTPTAIFCGFLPPLKNTSNPANASNFDGDDIIPVTFQLAKASGNCKTGPFDNNAQALLSIAQLTPTFNYIFPLKTLPQNGQFQPLGFAGLYSILLPVHANNLGVGEFSLSVLFQSGDAAQQSIVFNIVSEASIPSSQ
jgi:hypothetical protein